MYGVSPHTKNKLAQEEVAQDARAGTSLTKSMDRKHCVRGVGRHDNRAGVTKKSNICTRASKLLYEMEDREEDPNSGEDHLVGEIMVG